jgi:hypothetical protein
MADALRRAFHSLLAASPPELSARALRAGITILVAEPFSTSRPVLPSRGNGALAHHHQEQEDGWEDTRRRLHALYRTASREERVAIAGELGLAPATLRNAVSTGTPGPAIQTRIAEWLAARQEPKENGSATASSSDDDNLLYDATNSPGAGRSGSEAPNGDAQRLSPGQRDRLAFILERAPDAIRRGAAGVSFDAAQLAAEGVALEPHVLNRLVAFLET